jgi:ABC-type bacteriocin/lantibiotic exporter with double-glycine peptidase domain
MLFAFVAYKQQFVSRIGGLVDKAIEFKMLGLHSERVADIALADGVSLARLGMGRYREMVGTVMQEDRLTRAFYKGPRILFLDEATSHLDVHREKQVNEAIKALKITRIVVAHRPETVASVDRVILLGGGANTALYGEEALQKAA